MNIKVSVPSSVRPFIIGKQGANIKAMSQRTGAHIQLPKSETTKPTTADEDDDEMVDVEVRGNGLAVAQAQREIQAIVNERTSNLNTRIKTVPPEIFPFIAGPHGSLINALEQSRDVRIKVPHYHSWQGQVPTAPFAPQEGHHIQISGDRETVRQVQAEIERQVQELQAQLAINQVAIERQRHRFIIGQKGQELHDFLAETGCTVILPPSDQPNEEEIYVVGPPDKIEAAMDKVMDLASSMQMASVDVARQHPNAAPSHARDVSRYLQQRRALDEFERQYNAQIVTPTATDGPSAWTIYARDGRNSTKARSDLMNLVHAHPPTRFRNVSVHPYYQREIERQHAKQVRDQFGVHLVMPTEEESPLLLVYEGPTAASSYSFPRAKPSPAEVAEFEQALLQAEQYITALAANEAEISQRSVTAPAKYREKIHRFVNREAQKEPKPERPVQFINLEAANRGSGAGQFPLQFRGPATLVDDYADKIAAFIEEQIRDEAERDYTTSFDFPQKYANFLIGRKGENINKLRDEFDVDLQVENGKVEVKGPEKKANAAKAHILAMARKYEDETTHTLKLKPQFHRDLIGGKGSHVLRLQDRYNVRIQFPRNAATPADDRSVADDASVAGGASRYPQQAPDEVVIRGPSKGADQAREELLSLYQYAQDNSHTATVSIQQAQLGSLIGQRGREMDKLRLETGAQIDVPGSKDEADPSGRVEIRLKGSKSAVDAAKKLLESRAKAFDASVSRSIEVDKSHHRALIGGGGKKKCCSFVWTIANKMKGENLKRMIVEAGGVESDRRIIQFPRADASDNLIRLEGHKDVVEKLIAQIQAIVEGREQQVTEAVEVPPERHGGLIGRGGATRKGLEEKFGVAISIPSTSTTGPARSQVKVTGLPANVAQAKEHILGMTKEREGTTINVPKRLYHAVAEGNLFGNLNRNLGVKVDHAGQQKPPRPEASTAKLNGGAKGLPLITDAVLDPSALDVQEHHKWDLVDTAPAGDDSDTMPWVFKGQDADKVAKAVAIVQEAIKGAQNSSTGYLILPDPKSYRFVIGPSGSTVNTIRKETGCKIDVPKSGSSGEAIEIRGTHSAVEQAKEMIIDAVVDAQQR